MSEFSTAVEIGLPPQQVWSVLVATAERRRWYHDLLPEGEFSPGARITWRLPGGEAAEESTVREVTAPRRLVLESRLLFAPLLAEQPPHTITFEVEPAGAGSRVRMRVELSAGGPVWRLFESEGSSLLKGLQVELDPALQAELRPLEKIGEVEIRDVTPDLVGDYLDFFDNEAFRDYPAWSNCYCMETHLGGPAEQHAARTAADNREDMARLVASREVTALLAFTGEKPVGWCNYGPTRRLAGVMAKLKLDPTDEEGVGSIACFVISSRYRGHGLAGRLLEVACERLAARGLKWVEAYPYKAGGSAQVNYRGPLEMYLSAGFEPYRDLEGRLVVRKPLARA